MFLRLTKTDGRKCLFPIERVVTIEDPTIESKKQDLRIGAVVVSDLMTPKGPMVLQVQESVDCIASMLPSGM